MYILLNVFPIQFLALFAYFILRVILGLCLLYIGLSHTKKQRAQATPTTTMRTNPTLLLLLGIFEIGLGVVFIIGMYTQIAALLTLALALYILLAAPKSLRAVVPQPMVYVLLVGISLSLFITGAGVFAVDLPI